MHSFYICHAMRTNLFHIRFIALLAFAYFLLAGTGYNIVNYCCDTCETVGIEFIAHHSCHDLHHIDKSEPACCDHTAVLTPQLYDTSTCSVDQSCKLQRIAPDNYQVTSNAEVNIVQPVKDLAFAETDLFACSEILISYPVRYPPPDRFPSTGRALLSLKSVLII